MAAGTVFVLVAVFVLLGIPDPLPAVLLILAALVLLLAAWRADKYR